LEQEANGTRGSAIRFQPEFGSDADAN